MAIGSARIYAGDRSTLLLRNKLMMVRVVQLVQIREVVAKLRVLA